MRDSFTGPVLSVSRSKDGVRLQNLMGVSAMPPASDKLLRRGKWSHGPLPAVAPPSFA
jgi:hypothetical protein